MLYDNVLALFGKDVVQRIVFLFTHSVEFEENAVKHVLDEQAFGPLKS